jgi:DNA invertase Pin-like site-specific DNA recombinase
MKKIAIYCRVSTNDQTCENQRLRLIEYAEKNNFQYDVFTETESTRKTRPVKRGLMNRLRKDEYFSVCVYKPDRWARSSTELILDVTELTKKGIGFISISDSLDFTTAVGKLQFQILSAFAEFERELIREWTIEGLKRAKTQGKKLGRPFGAKDNRQRRRSGYILREANKKQLQAQEKGNFQPIEIFLNNTPSNN